MAGPLGWDSRDLDSVSKLGTEICCPGKITEFAQCFLHLQYGKNISTGIKSSREQAELTWSNVIQEELLLNLEGKIMIPCLSPTRCHGNVLIHGSEVADNILDQQVF